LGYVPDIRGRSLSRGAIKMIGVASDVPNLLSGEQTQWWFWPRLLSSLASSLTEQGIGLSILSRPNLEQLENIPVDALIYLSKEPSDSLPHELQERVTTYFISLTPGCETGDSASDGVRSLSEAAMDHMREAGSSHPALLLLQELGGALGQIIAGYEQWCRRRGVEPIIVTGSADVDLDMALRCAVDAGVDGFFLIAGETQAALELLKAVGVGVPADAVLVSLSEGTVEQHLRPSVTTVSIEGERAGVLLAEAVVHLLRTGEVPDFDPPWVLTARESTSG
jgi:DNA-binding LacI/PurR family transcriptional regulator